jgi:predicted alpha/beta hydrolase
MTGGGDDGRPLTLTASDGVPLAARLFEPARPTGQPVLVAGGLGVGQRFYRRFAQWLASQGRPVLTFDLRGMGDSRLPAHRKSLRGLDIDMLGWARLDFAAAVAWLAGLADDGRIQVVGHSLGAHHAAMTGAATQQRIETLVAVAAGSGYWRDWNPPSRRKAPLMLHLAGPLLIPALGWFPGRRLGMVGDLPGPAARQWMRWCRHPGFAWGAEPAALAPSLDSARFSIRAFGFRDDDAMSEWCCRKLLQAMPHASSTLTMLKPMDVGMASIGHIGAFRAEAAQRLWPMMMM